MNVFDKSLLALDAYLAQAKQEELQKILEDVGGVCYEGPNLEDFFTTIFQNKPLRFKFQNGVTYYADSKPPPVGFQLISQTPKETLESFFCNIALWKHQSQQYLN
ncbi:MAG: hypothetical protein IPF69_11360 [Chitinophagaceae bacterium]|nr:hypothetical protein [Chitinophagaceae bacterium]MBK8299068.1 hypothetical protein [Chitinophagaceae bacterium]MBK9659750.1 hypothetical protein [Chitinophagaceae bacterium]MBP6415499.1 hypothetical protein [Chitinophagaceae bacterium]MBP8115375.1 hypothetical protein [Chitinophagaceae bacterium]